MSAVQFIVLFVRWFTLAAFLIAIVAFCSAAALRRHEGIAAAAVRITLTLLGPATFLAFTHVFWWPIALVLSLAVAVWQGWGALGVLVARTQQTWSMFSLVSKVALCALAIAISFRIGAAVSMPPADGDSLLYHLPLTAALIQDHSMWFTRAIPYPGAVELGEALTGGTIGNVNGVAAFEALQIVVFMFAAFAWTRKAGGTIDGAAASSVVAGSLPIVVDQMGTSQNDIFVCAIIVCACALWSSSPRLAALALGLTFAAKLTSFFLVPAVAIAMLASEGWTFSASDILWGAAIAGSWYVRTWVVTGSPIYSIASMGWRSTIAAHLSAALPFVITALRTYGGLAALAGVAALIYLAVTGRRRPRFARLLPWLGLLAFIAWILMPNTAENVAGTLDQIRQGWSLRYAIILPFILATSLTIALDDVSQLPIAAFVGLVAAASAIVRSANATASSASIGIFFGLPLLVATFFVYLSMRSFSRSRFKFVGAICLAAAVATFALTATVGAKIMTRLWDPAYLQWSLAMPVNDVDLDRNVRSSTRIAVVGMRSFPLVGPRFERRTYENVLATPASLWLKELRRDHVALLIAADESGSPDQPGFMKPLPIEGTIARQPGTCLLSTRTGARVYGLDSRACANRR